MSDLKFIGLCMVVSSMILSGNDGWSAFAFILIIIVIYAVTNT